MVQDNQNRKTMGSLITSLIAMVLTIVINFFLSPYIVANFGEEANGFTQLANNFINYASLITIALNSMSGRFIAISYYREDYDACNKYYSSIILGNVSIMVVLFFPAMYCVAFLDSLIRIETADVWHVKLLFALAFANFYISQCNSILTIAVYVKNAQYIQNTVNMMKTLFNAGGLVIIFMTFTPRIYYVGLIGFILSIMTIPVFYTVKCRILPEIKFSLKCFDIAVIWKLVSSGIWNTLNQCGNLLMTGLDLLLSNLFIGPIEMGILSVAKTIPNCIVQLAGTVNTSFSPNLTIAYAESNEKKIIRSLRYAMTCSSVLVSIPVMAICVYGSAFYKLWVPSMDAVQLTVLSFLTCMAFIPFSGPQVLYNVYTTTNRLKLNSISVVVGGLINFVLVFIFLKYTKLGLVAVAGTSSMISIIRNLIITVPYTAKILGLKWYTFYKDVLLSCIFCLMNGVICVISKRLIVPDTWVSMLISAGIACLISLFILTFVLKKMKKE